MKRALERIYRRHGQGLFTLALAITRCPARAEDAVQEAFARLWRSKRPAEADMVPYVFAAVRNAAIDQLRRSRRPAGVPVSIFNGAEARPEERAIDAERRRFVAEAMYALPAPQREAIVLRIYAGLSFRQIAEMLDEPLQTVAARYRRGLERLRARIPKEL